jgi:hypothetical protein
MSPRTRTILAVIGIALLLLSMAVLVYALWPLDSTSRQIPLPPELFNRPLSALDWLGAIT